MRSCRECCYAAPTGANLYCSMNDCYVGELTCDDFEPIVKAKTNADRIRAMSDEELAEWLGSRGDNCPRAGCYKGSCHECWIDWLKSPVEVGE